MQGLSFFLLLTIVTTVTAQSGIIMTVAQSKVTLYNCVQSAQTDNFVFLNYQTHFLSTVTMENGDGSVTMKVSGPIIRDQRLFVDNWDIMIILVSQMCPKNKIHLLSLLRQIAGHLGQPNVTSQDGSRRVVTLSDCNGPRLTECTVTLSDSCVTNSVVRLTCAPG